MEHARIATPHGAHGPQGTQTARGKPQAQPAGGAEDPGMVGGFLALFAALDGAAQDTILPVDTVSGSDAGDTAVAQVDPAAMAAWQGLWGAAEAVAVPATVVLPAIGGGMAVSGAMEAVGSGAGGRATVPLAAGGGLAAPGAVGAAGSDEAGTGGLSFSGVSGLDVSGVRQVPGADVPSAFDGGAPQTTLPDHPADRPGSAPAGTVAGYSRIFSHIQQALSPGDAPAATATAWAAKAGKKQGLAMAAAALAQTPPSGGAQRVVGQASESGPQRGMPEFFPVPMTGALAQAVEDLSQDRAPRQKDQPTERGADNGSSRNVARSDWSNASAGQALGGGDPGAMPTDPVQVGVEEQVAYWVNQKTQNAEMTLDRDGQPVEVTVSLSGNEAHVTFRSDQAQTRDLLDASMSQLRDLLRNEGLVLSGTTVDTSARDSARSHDSGQQRESGAGGREQATATVPVANAMAARKGGATEHAVDIFV